MTIINHTWKFIFIHIPKCGGTSVAHALEPLCGIGDLQLGGTPFGEKCHAAYGPKFGIAKHSFAVEARRAVGERHFREYTTFTTVRDPASRVISMFNYLKLHEAHYTFMKPVDSVSDFLRSERWETHGPDRMFLPQIRWIYDERPPKPRMIDALIPIDRMGELIPDLLRDIGVPNAKVARLQFERKNKSPETSVKLAPSDHEAIAKRYSEDYEQIAKL